MILERQTIHVADDAGRIAMLEKRTIGTDDAKEVLTRYVYSNHLQSASLELDEEANIISYEEYHPYGTTAFQAKNATINAVAKRYRYTGKERDEESGLYYHGARYYIPWLARWTAIDPLESKYAGMSPYNYGNCNPITFNDPSGMEGEEQIGSWVRTSEGKVRYNSKVNNLEDATRSYGDGASIFSVGHNYTSKTGNKIVLGVNGKFTNNGELQTSPDDRANYVEDNFKFTNLGMAFEAQRRSEAAAEAYFLKTKFLLADGSTMTGTQIRRAEYERVEAGGAAIRNGPFAAGVSLLYNAVGNDPMRGALVGSVVDGVAMSFAGVGTPYGKIDPITKTSEIFPRMEQRPEEMVEVFRKTDNVNEIEIFEETGYIMSAAARVGYKEGGDNIAAALNASVKAHEIQLKFWWGSQKAYAEARGHFGIEKEEVGEWSLISFTTDLNSIRTILGEYIMWGWVPKRLLIRQVMNRKDLLNT